MSNKCVSSKIKIKGPVLKRLSKASITALEKTATALKTEVINAQVMPFDTGNMQNANTFVDYDNSSKGQASLVTSTPYARRLYFHAEYVVSNMSNMYARGEWLADWIYGDKQDFASKTFTEFYKKEAKL